MKTKTDCNMPIQYFEVILNVYFAYSKLFSVEIKTKTKKKPKNNNPATH